MKINLSHVVKLICMSVFLAFFIMVLAPVEGKSWIVKAEFLSPDIMQFDCHSSSIAETSPGNLCAVWKAGPGAGESNVNIKENVGIWSSLFDGDRWSAPIEIVTAAHSVCWNPVLCKYPDGDLLLFYRIGLDPRRTVSFMKKSQNGGLSWSQAEILPAGIVGPAKNKPILTANEILICPSSVAVGEPEELFKATACWIEITDDKGLHWKKVGPLVLPHRKFGVIEPALFFDKDGNLRMYCRDRANRIGEKGFIWESISQDGGWHWSELRQTNFPNPDSAFDVVDFGKGMLMLVYNHSHTDRFPLNFAISLDGGDQWSLPCLLDDTGEFPSAIVTADGLVHVTYAIMASQSEQRRIKHVIIDPTLVFDDFRKECY